MRFWGEVETLDSLGNQDGNQEQLRLLAINAVIANHVIQTASGDKLKAIATTAAKLMGADEADPISMRNMTADLSCIPKLQQMHIVSKACQVLGFKPEIEGCEWIPVDYKDGVTDQTIATTLGVMRDVRETIILWSKDRFDFQAFYYKGLSFTYDHTFEFINPT